MKIPTYMPLAMAQKYDELTLENNNNENNAFAQIVQEDQNVLSFLCSDSLLTNSKYKGTYSYINEFIMKNQRVFDNAITSYNTRHKIHTDSSTKATPDFMKEITKHIFISTYVINIWSKNKQIYKFDKELEHALATSMNFENEIVLPSQLLDRIPYDTFYIEFADNGEFKQNFHGTFISIHKESNGYLLNFIHIPYEDKMDSCVSTMRFIQCKNDNTKLVLTLENTDMSIYVAKYDKCSNLYTFLMNALLYLCADNNEIRESEKTKQTYRPSNRIRNKFSEIRQWECGYRYGAEVRKHKSATNNAETTSHVSPTSRKPMVEHLRKAHWHHYWTGKRDSDERKLILHWIPPTFVHGTKCDAAVMHVVKD